ncbi:MAG: hypothetical protein WD294_04465 [Phycisphaeraceae bacterium]
MFKRIGVRAGAIVLASAAAFAATAGCQSSPENTHRREVVIYDTPRFGAADALGFMVFVVHPERTEQRQRTRLIATTAQPLGMPTGLTGPLLAADVSP